MVKMKGTGNEIPVELKRVEFKKKQSQIKIKVVIHILFFQIKILKIGT